MILQSGSSSRYATLFTDWLILANQNALLIINGVQYKSNTSTKFLKNGTNTTKIYAYGLKVSKTIQILFTEGFKQQLTVIILNF